MSFVGKPRQKRRPAEEEKENTKRVARAEEEEAEMQHAAEMTDAAEMADESDARAREEEAQKSPTMDTEEQAAAREEEADTRARAEEAQKSPTMDTEEEQADAREEEAAAAARELISQIEQILPQPLNKEQNIQGQLNEIISYLTDLSSLNTTKLPGCQELEMAPVDYVEYIPDDGEETAITMGVGMKDAGQETDTTMGQGLKDAGQELQHQPSYQDVFLFNKEPYAEATGCACDEFVLEPPGSAPLDTSFKISDYLFKVYVALGFTVNPPTVEGMPEGYYSDTPDTTITNMNKVILFIYVHGGIEVIDGEFNTFPSPIDETFTIKYGIRGVSTLANLYERYLSFIKIYNATNEKINEGNYNDMDIVIPLINETFFSVFPTQKRCSSHPVLIEEHKKSNEAWLSTTTIDRIIKIQQETIDRNSEAARLTATSKSVSSDTITITDREKITSDVQFAIELEKLEKYKAEAAEAEAVAAETALKKAKAAKAAKAKAAKVKAAVGSAIAAAIEAEDAQKNLVYVTQFLNKVRMLYNQRYAKNLRLKIYQPDGAGKNRNFNHPNYTLRYIPKKNPDPRAPAPTIVSTLDRRVFDINDGRIIYNNAGNINKLNQYLFDECIRFKDLGIPEPDLDQVNTVDTVAGTAPAETTYRDYSPRDIIMLYDIQFDIPRCKNNVTGKTFYPRHVVIKKNESFITNPHVVEFFITMFGVKILLRPIYIHSTDTDKPVSSGSKSATLGKYLHSDYRFFKSSPIGSDYKNANTESLINYRYKVFPEEINNLMIYELCKVSNINTCTMFDNSCENLMCFGKKPDAATEESLKRSMTTGGGASKKINTMKRLGRGHGRDKRTMKRKRLGHGHGRDKRTMKRKRLGHGHKKRTMKRKRLGHGHNKKTMKRKRLGHGHGRDKRTMKRNRTLK
jgi:hypothetical protein